MFVYETFFVAWTKKSVLDMKHSFEIPTNEPVIRIKIRNFCVKLNLKRYTKKNSLLEISLFPKYKQSRLKACEKNTGAEALGLPSSPFSHSSQHCRNSHECYFQQRRSMHLRNMRLWSLNTLWDYSCSQPHRNRSSAISPKMGRPRRLHLIH